jgi:hypothetical protein
MGRLSILVVLAALGSGCGDGGGPPDPLSQQLANCRQGLANACARLVACGTTTPAGAEAAAAIAACTAMLADRECTPDQVACPPTETYHPDQDVACAAGFTDWTCDQIATGGDHFPPPPAACYAKCQ